MEYKIYGDTVAIRLDKRDEITESVKKVAELEKIFCGTVTGIGATDDFTVGVFDVKKAEYEKKRYNGNHEINAIIGNVTEKDKNPYIHLHITCTGKDGKVVGGHLICGKISLTGEIFLQKISGKITRFYDPDLKINRIKPE